MTKDSELHVDLPDSVREKIRKILNDYCLDKNVPLTEKLLEKKTEEMLSVVSSELADIISEKRAKKSKQETPQKATSKQETIEPECM